MYRVPRKSTFHSDLDTFLKIAQKIASELQVLRWALTFRAFLSFIDCSPFNRSNIIYIKLICKMYETDLFGVHSFKMAALC